MENAKLVFKGNEFQLPVTVGSEGEVGIDITQLRNRNIY
jgi:hypothetical protein